MSQWDEKEPPIDPPTEQECEVKRTYLPMREYYVTIYDADFSLYAEVDQDGKGNLNVSQVGQIDECLRDYGYKWNACPNYFLNSRPADCSDTWRTLILRDVCYQAADLKGWKTEYYEKEKRSWDE